MEPPVQWFLGLAERYGLRELPLDARLALTVLTSDENIPKYPGVKTLW